MLFETAERVPDNPSLLLGEQVIATYRQFADRAASLALLLCQDHGIAPGDRVAIFARNAPEYLIALYGIWCAGAIAVPVNCKLHPREVDYILANSGAKLVIVDGNTPSGFAPEIPVLVFSDFPETGDEAREPHPSGPDDSAWLFYTSGTTGKPKGVDLTFGNLSAMSEAYVIDVDAVHEGDAAFYAAPMSHGAGLYNFMFVKAGARHIVPPTDGFDTEYICKMAPRLGNLSMFAAPTMVKRLVGKARELDYSGEGIRTIVYGGGPMYVADAIEAFNQFGDRFIQIYGQGECPMCLTVLTRDEVADRHHPNWASRLGSVGRAQSCVELKTIRADGTACRVGETGEIVAKGRPVMRGYWRNAQATAEALADGWLRTGDMGSLDADGYLTLRDRSKDVIISGGSNVYPREVEEALLSHECVQEVAVVGRPSAEWGEEVVAFVVPAQDAAQDAEALRRHCRSQIAAFKVPKAILFTDDLPKNNYGKVVKTELRERLGIDSQAKTSSAR
ncbi:class I adenylate-forming enzyme family protein [Kangsaoukella pontilimi]|nr:AMP-binding protein [Kangsaoukella pontilimi]